MNPTIRLTYKQLLYSKPSISNIINSLKGARQSAEDFANGAGITGAGFVLKILKDNIDFLEKYEKTD